MYLVFNKLPWSIKKIILSFFSLRNELERYLIQPYMNDIFSELIEKKIIDTLPSSTDVDYSFDFSFVSKIIHVSSLLDKERIIEIFKTHYEKDTDSIIYNSEYKYDIGIVNNIDLKIINAFNYGIGRVYDIQKTIIFFDITEEFELILLMDHLDGYFLNMFEMINLVDNDNMIFLKKWSIILIDNRIIIVRLITLY